MFALGADICTIKQSFVNDYPKTTKTNKDQIIPWGWCFLIKTMKKWDHDTWLHEPARVLCEGFSANGDAALTDR